MENTEIIDNTEEIVDVVEAAVEEFVPARKTNGWKVFGITGLVIAGVGAVYTFVVKPIMASRKAKQAELEEYQKLTSNDNEENVDMDEDQENFTEEG